MKAVFPKNIKKGILAGLTFSIGPLSISIIQLFILAAGIAIAIVTFSKFSQNSKVGASIFAIFIFLIFLVIAFFKVSELHLLAFTAKMIQNYFLDVTKKFQCNYDKVNKTKLSIEKFKIKNTKQKIEYKSRLNIENIDELDQSGLL